MSHFLGKDKLYHFLVCLFAALVHPAFGIGLALGKEYGDYRAQGNHWCWYDIIFDVLGIIVGILIKVFIKNYESICL